MSHTLKAAPGPRGWRGSVRIRLFILALLPTLVVAPLLIGWTMVRWNAKFDAMLHSKVHGDLTIAHQYFTRILEMTGERVRALGLSALFQERLAAGTSGHLDELLEQQRGALGLDFLYLIDADRRIVAMARLASPSAMSDGPPSGSVPMHAPLDRGQDRQAAISSTVLRAVKNEGPVIAAALAGGTRTAVDVFTPSQLAALSPDLAERARIEVVHPSGPVAAARRSEESGLVVHAAAAVPLPDGRVGALVAGILLNQNLAFIDTINDLVYRDNSLPDGSKGSATLFLGDVRISTNVRLFEGRRALGTRVSHAVREHVLGEGRTWLGSAFVVNDWYMSAYEPILDSSGARVGMLYVGFLEHPFTHAKKITLISVILAFLALAGLSVPIFLRWARAVFRPVERMDETIARFEAGTRTARTGLVYGEDELGRVARNLDRLLDRLAANERELLAWNDTLNKRVEERTKALELANREIEATTRQLILSEKLAAVGEITAGVAHEINNPVAVIQGNLDVLRDLVFRSDAGRTELRLIDEQIARITQIINRLLQFARPEEYAEADESHAPGEVVADCLPLVRHLIERAAIEIMRTDTSTRRVRMSRTELQQVIINLIVNAVHAMPEGGLLSLNCRDMDREGRPGVGIEVADTGTGMSAQILSRIFDPFFSTKAARGNGLGLSISRKLVLRQDGEIDVRSAPGEGTAFIVFLPAAH